MAIRLYPNTDDTALLERLAGVPAGTTAELRAFEAERAVAEVAEDARNRTLVRLLEWAGKIDPDVHYDQAFLDAGFRTYELLHEQPHLSALHDFRLWGWGRLSPAGVEAVEAAGLDPVCGGTGDRLLVISLVLGQPWLEDPGQALAVLAGEGVGLFWG